MTILEFKNRLRQAGYTLVPNSSSYGYREYSKEDVFVSIFSPEGYGWPVIRRAGRPEERFATYEGAWNAIKDV